jgi:uncharacterized glyoxalase superfamily protein PhnB
MTPHIYPVARYERAHQAIEWLGRAFGFEARTVFEGPDKTVAHAELTCGTGTVGLSSAGPPDPANAWTRVRHGIYVCLPDPVTHHARARAAGATIERDLREMDYGSLEYTARDLEGHLWSFGTYGMSHAEGPPVFFPELRYANGRGAVEFLTRAFSLEPGLQACGADGQVHHAELWMADDALLVGSGADHHDRWRGRSFCTHVVVEDPDGHHARAEAAGATILQAPSDTSYGARSYLTQDPEGFLWGFSTYRPQRAQAG